MTTLGSKLVPEAVLSRVSSIASQHLAEPQILETQPLERQQRLVEDLGLDSVRLLTLAVEVEDAFEICLDPEDEAAIVTVGDLVDVICAKSKVGAPGDS